MSAIRYLSLFSGIEAATLAAEPLGWEAAAFAEIDPFPAAVLAERWPEVPNLGDVRGIDEAALGGLGRIALVVGGSPCQGLSVAGRRKGLNDPRSGLFLEMMRVFDAARSVCGARFLLWENVPGAFTTAGGRDFAAVLGHMAGGAWDRPRDGWRNCGVALGPRGLVEWRVINALGVGGCALHGDWRERGPVPQRRRRLFALLDTGDWAGRRPVLLEPESLRRDFAACSEEREGVAGSVSARAQSGGGLGTDFECDGGVVPAVADCIAANGASRRTNLEGHGAYVATCPAVPASGRGFERVGESRGQDPVVVAYGGNNTAGSIDVATAQNAKGGSGRMDFGSETFVTVAFSCKDNGADAGPVSPPIRAVGHDASHANAGGQVAVALSLRGRDGGATAELSGETMPAVRASQGCGDKPHVLTETAVRRLTPIEVERLFMMPDNYTRIPWRGKPAEQCPDGPRYKALGNSMCVNVMRWIFQRLEEAI